MLRLENRKAVGPAEIRPDSTLFSLIYFCLLQTFQAGADGTLDRRFSTFLLLIVTATLPLPPPPPTLSLAGRECTCACTPLLGTASVLSSAILMLIQGFGGASNNNYTVCLADEEKLKTSFLGAASEVSEPTSFKLGWPSGPAGIPRLSDGGGDGGQ